MQKRPLATWNPASSVWETDEDHLCGHLAEIGYDAAWTGLRAADVGAPHGRWRVFVLAWRRDDPDALTWPQSDPGALLATPNASQGAPLRTPPSDYSDLGRQIAPLPAVAQDEAQQRIVDRAELEPTSGCWLWTGWTNQAATPYGRISIDGRKVYAHRASYEAFTGPIPDGYEIDHLCQSSLCVNPSHLEAVTPEENRDRVTQRRTHCKRGHEFTEENTYWVRPGARACRTCRAWQDKLDKARRKGEQVPEIPLLPTPACNDMGASYTPETWDEWTERMRSEHGNGNGHGKSLHIEALRLLKTPTSQLAVNGGSQHPDKRKAGGHGPTLADEVEHLLPTPRATRGGSATETAALLPTPRATDGTKGGPNQRGSSGDLMLPSAVTLLPTPSVADVEGGRKSRSGTRSDELLLNGIAAEQRWGDYAPAIARWEAVLGRPAPDPTEQDWGRWERQKRSRLASKKPVGMRGSIRFILDGPPHRLSPAFVEWMMGLPSGWVTDPAIWEGVKPSAARNAQLTALGNGVVPQQAAAALRWLLEVRRAVTG